MAADEKSTRSGLSFVDVLQPNWSQKTQVHGNNEVRQIAKPTG
jgi:hypothetical protein